MEAQKKMEDGKRVLFIVPQPFLVYRGSPFRVQASITAIAELGYKIDLLCFPMGLDIDIPNVRIIRSFSCPGIQSVPIGLSVQKVILDVLLAIKALQLVFSNNYALIHGVEETGIIAKTLGFFKKIPYIFDMHSRIPEQMKTYAPALQKLAEKFEKFCASSASAVITVGDEMTGFIRNLCPGKPVFSLEDLPISVPSDTSANTIKALRDKCGIGEGERTILYTGNFEPYQGVNLLIRSFAAVIKNTIAGRFKLVLVGGVDGEFNYEGSKKLAKELGLEHQVVFPGSRPPEEMGTFYAMADIVTSPRIEGTNTPLKIYSYMLARRPQVATDMLSHTQVLNESNSFLGKPNEADFAKAFLECISAIENNHDEITRRVDRAEKLVKERFNPEKFKLTLKEAYDTANIAR